MQRVVEEHSEDMCETRCQFALVLFLGSSLQTKTRVELQLVLCETDSASPCGSKTWIEDLGGK